MGPKTNPSRFVTSSLVVGLISTTSLLGSGAAFAKSAASTNAVTPLPHASKVATVVVDNPPGRSDAPATAPAAVVAPTPVAQAPVVQEPTRREVVHADVGHTHNYMSTVALSALMGGVAGALVGGAIYFIDGSQPARNIGYWTAGGVLVGTGVGVAQIMVEESHTSQALSLMPRDPVPTYRLALWRAPF